MTPSRRNKIPSLGTLIKRKLPSTPELQDIFINNSGNLTKMAKDIAEQQSACSQSWSTRRQNWDRTFQLHNNSDHVVETKNNKKTFLKSSILLGLVNTKQENSNQNEICFNIAPFDDWATFFLFSARKTANCLRVNREKRPRRRNGKK